MKVEYRNIPVKDLRPSQSEIDLDKIIRYLDNKEDIERCFEDPVDFEDPMVTFNGKYVVDGHHRWANAFIVNPEANVSCLDFSTEEHEKKEDVYDFIDRFDGAKASKDKIKLDLYEVSKKKLLEALNDILTDEVCRTILDLSGTKDEGDGSLNWTIINARGYLAENIAKLKKIKADKDAPDRVSMPQTVTESVIAEMIMEDTHALEAATPSKMHMDIVRFNWKGAYDSVIDKLDSDVPDPSRLPPTEIDFIKFVLKFNSALFQSDCPRYDASIPISKVVPTNTERYTKEYRNWDSLEEAADQLKAEGKDTFILRQSAGTFDFDLRIQVIKFQGLYGIVDGNHRYVMAREKDFDKIGASVRDIDRWLAESLSDDTIKKPIDWVKVRTHNMIKMPGGRGYKYQTDLPNIRGVAPGKKETVFWRAVSIDNDRAIIIPGEDYKKALLNGQPVPEEIE